MKANFSLTKKKRPDAHEESEYSGVYEFSRVNLKSNNQGSEFIEANYIDVLQSWWISWRIQMIQ